MIYRTGDESPPTRDWHEEVKGILKAEIKRRSLTYAQLSERLERIGVEESERNLRTKISRGNFTAVFFIQCIAALGVRNLRFDWYDDPRYELDMGQGELSTPRKK